MATAKTKLPANLKDATRVEQVRYLMEDGKGPKLSAADAAKVLGISRNAVYQQLRKARGAKPSGRRQRGATARTQRRQSGRKAARRSPQRRRQAPAEPKPVTATMSVPTPEDVISSRLEQVTAEITSNEQTISAAQAAQVELVNEQARLKAASDALQGPPKAPPAAKPSGGKGGGRRRSGGKSTSANGGKPNAERAEAEAAQAAAEEAQA